MNWSTSRHSFSSSSRGFTLVEVLVAISVLAILMTSIYGIFSSVSLARERLDSDSAEYHRARVLFDRLGRELRGTYFQIKDPNLVFSGSSTADALEFELTTTAVSPLSQKGSGIAKVRYLLIEDKEAAAKSLVLMRSEQSGHESTGDNAAGMMRLAPGIAAMTLRFYADGQWRAEWDGRIDGLPELVEIALQLRTDGGETTDFVSAFEVPEVELR